MAVPGRPRLIPLRDQLPLDFAAVGGRSETAGESRCRLAARLAAFAFSTVSERIASIERARLMSLSVRGNGRPGCTDGEALLLAEVSLPREPDRALGVLDGARGVLVRGTIRGGEFLLRDRDLLLRDCRRMPLLPEEREWDLTSSDWLRRGRFTVR